MVYVKKKLTERQKKVLRRVRKQVNKNEMVSVSKAMQGIYSPATARHPEKITALPEFWQILDTYLPEEKLAERHKELLDKRDYLTHVVGRGKKARVIKIDLGPETQAVSKALDMGYKIRNRYPKEGGSIAVQFNFGQHREKYT